MKNRPKRFIRSSKEEMLTILSVCRFTIQRLMNLTMPMTWLMLFAGGQMLRITPE